MNNTSKYQLSDAHAQALFDMITPLLQGGVTKEYETKIEEFWRARGKEMGFVWHSARPVDSKGDVKTFKDIQEFTAIPLH